MSFEIFTSANLAYLPQATVLAESIRRHAPEARFTMILVDGRPPENSLLSERLSPQFFDDVVTAEDLLGPEHEKWMFGYDVVEACTAIKGRALRSLLGRGLPVVYLDPDTALFGPLDDFVESLNKSSVLLTPHLHQPVPIDSQGLEDEICTLAHGIYNFGMFGVRPCDEGLQFADWWSSRLEEFCVDDVPRGLFVDQRWGDFVPAYFPQSQIYRNLGVNVASWNLHQRQVEIDKRGDYLVNGYPLVHFHFTKATGVGFHVSREKMLENPLVADLWRWYLEKLEEHALPQKIPAWRYGVYQSGREIPREDRIAYRALESDCRPNDPYSGNWLSSAASA